MPRLSILSGGLDQFLLCGDLGGWGWLCRKQVACFRGGPWKGNRGEHLGPCSRFRSSSSEACPPHPAPRQQQWRRGALLLMSPPDHVPIRVSPWGWRLETSAPRGERGLSAVCRDVRLVPKQGKLRRRNSSFGQRAALLGDAFLHPCPVHFSGVAVGPPVGSWWIVKE